MAAVYLPDSWLWFRLDFLSPGLDLSPLPLPSQEHPGFPSQGLLTFLSSFLQSHGQRVSLILAPDEISIPQKLACEPLSRSTMNPAKRSHFAHVTLGWVLSVAF